MRSRSRSPPSQPRSSRSSRHHEPQSSTYRPRDRDRFGRSESRRGPRADHHHRDQFRKEREHSPQERALVKERPRSRSIERRERHPRFDRDRGGDRLRERDRRDRDRDRRSNGRPNDRNGSPAINRDHRRRTRSRSHSRSPSPKTGAVPKFLMNRPEITDKDLEGKTEEEREMMKLMGFAGFDSTKGKPVQGNNVSAVNVLQKRKYRQYMNRKGGFNRPLDFVA